MATLAPPRLRTRTIVVPALAAALLAAAAAVAEVGVIAGAWSDCVLTDDAGARSGLLLLLPVLWVVQAALIGVPAPLLARRSPNRLVVTGLMAALAVTVVAVTAYVVFVGAGLPSIDPDHCPGGAPGWWPSWLPPAPRPPLL